MGIQDIIRDQQSISEEELMDTDIVLVDTSCDNRVNDQSVIPYLGSKKEVATLDSQMMDGFVQEFEKINRILQNENAHITPEISSEFNRLKKVMKRQFRRLKSRTGNYLIRSNEDTRSKIEKGLRLLDPLEEVIKNLIESSKNNVLDFSEYLDYTHLVEFTNFLTEETGAKVDLNYYHKRSKKDKSRIVGTDEKIIASAYHCSMDGKKVNIITRDYTDFNGLINHTAAVLNLDSCSQSECGLREALLDYPVNAYIPQTDGNFKLINGTEQAIPYRKSLSKNRRGLTIRQVDTQASECLARISNN